MFPDIKVENKTEDKDNVILTAISELNNKILEMDKKINQPTAMNSQLSDLTNKILEIEQNRQPTVNNNYFNISVYLDGRCGNAMNLDDFMKSIVIEDDECNMFISKRYLAGTIELLRRRLSGLTVEERPIHCLHGEDKRQSILHVRNNDEWFEELEKDWLYQITAIEDDDDIEKGKLLNLYRSFKLYDDSILSQFKKLIQNKLDYKKNRVEYDIHDRKMLSGSANSMNKITIINHLLEFAKVDMRTNKN